MTPAEELRDARALVAALSRQECARCTHTLVRHLNAICAGALFGAPCECAEFVRQEEQLELT